MGEVGIPELLVILGITLLVFGPSRLPGLARGLGESIRNFRQAMREGEHDQPSGPRQ